MIHVNKIHVISYKKHVGVLVDIRKILIWIVGSRINSLWLTKNIDRIICHACLMEILRHVLLFDQVC